MPFLKDNSDLLIGILHEVEWNNDKDTLEFFNEMVKLAEAMLNDNFFTSKVFYEYLTLKNHYIFLEELD